MTSFAKVSYSFNPSISLHLRLANRANLGRGVIASRQGLTDESDNLVDHPGGDLVACLLENDILKRDTSISEPTPGGDRLLQPGQDRLAPMVRHQLVRSAGEIEDPLPGQTARQERAQSLLLLLRRLRQGAIPQGLVLGTDIRVTEEETGEVIFPHGLEQRVREGLGAQELRAWRGGRGPGGEFRQACAVGHQVHVVRAADDDDSGGDPGLVEDAAPCRVASEGDAQGEMGRDSAFRVGEDVGWEVVDQERGVSRGALCSGD